MRKSENFVDGLFSNNPLFVFVLGACPTLAVSSTTFGGIAIGLCTMFVLLFSSFTVSLIKNLIPYKIEITTSLIIIATYTAVVQSLLYTFYPLLYERIGIYCPLIVANVVILRRVTLFSIDNSIFASTIDALGNGMGFILALFLLSSIRELLGCGRWFDIQLIDEDYISSLFVLAPGSLITLGLLVALFKSVKKA
jgi:electron transport complex protein RnfE